MHAQVKIDCSGQTNEQLVQQLRSGRSLMEIESVFNPELKLTIGSLGQRDEQESPHGLLSLNMRSQDPNFLTALVSV